MSAPFNAEARRESLDREEEYDLIVVGGGINGCGLAWEAARRGVRTLLLEKGDLGSGTSSRSSRLIHGGLRYLRHGHVKVVWEGTWERGHLRSAYPFLVRPLSFLIPFYEGAGEGPVLTQVGLWLYDVLAGFNVRPHRTLSRKEVEAREPGLRREGLRGGGLYTDCRTDDFRLVLLNAKLAHGAGARIVPYAKVEALRWTGGRVAGVRFRDQIQGDAYEASARLVVNATGPWSDAFRAQVAGAEARLRPTKGVHILLPRERVGNRRAVVLRSPSDERVVFALPWGPYALVGTTDTDYDGSLDDVRADAGDVAYLLDAVNHAFPEADVAPADVISAYAALRPLVAEYGVSESDVSRDFRVVEDAPGLLSVLGGKLTTYRRAARQALKQVDRRLRRRRGGAPAPSPATMTGVELEELRGWLEDERGALGWDDPVVRHLLASFGRESREILRYAQGEELRRRLVPSLPYVWAEVAYAVDHEMALRLEDVLVRRTGLLHEDPAHGMGVAGEVASFMARRLGWDDAHRREEEDAYARAVEASQAFRERT